MLSGLELDLTEAKNNIKTFGAKTTLMIEIAGTPVEPNPWAFFNKYAQSVTNTFYLTITDSELNKLIWRALYPLSTTYGYADSDVDNMVQKLIATMRKDGLLE
jgi:hypothetical protein